ncbi:uncharacterized protein [Rutidosis leptorrhynchoides]|uniref:uncharacterized protein n=1 Tax=Rutidosis leptorrhynchoides TaxID=125765 RepID=UPI003A997DEE
MRLIEQELNDMGISLHNYFEKVVNKGDSTLFWKDNWLDGQALCDRFGRLFRLEENQDVLVIDRIVKSANTWTVTGCWARPPSGRTLGELDELHKIIGNLSFNENGDDTWKCGLHSNDLFSVSTLTHIIDQKILPSSASDVETMCNKLLPQKVSIFIWRALLRRILVRVELDKRNIDLNSLRCPICDDDIETVDHILIKCSFAKDLWSRVYRWWNIGNSVDIDLDERFKWKINVANSTSKLWQAIEWICGYTIWQNRNQAIFRKKKGNGPMALNEIQINSFEWISSRSKKIKLD